MNDKKPPPDQAQKFKDAARQIGADDDEGRWEKRLREVAKPKPKARGGK